ncbi:MAG: hypothetical protein ACNFW9_05155 [Candidatus Kerfeldbacteria bacterium]
MIELIKSVNKKEWWLVIGIATLLVIITAVPYLYGYFSTPEDMVYTGLHHFAPGDTNVFLSMIEQVRQDENIFINLYTSEDQLRIYTNPLWLTVGWVAKIFSLSNLLSIHVVRSILIFIFVAVMYLFLSYLFKKIKKRKLILLIILFSSGLGSFFNPFLYDTGNIYEHPTDIWVTESITFSTLFHTPHLTASLTLIVVIFLFMLLAFEKNKYLYSVLAGFACLLMLWFHPFNGPTIYGVLAVYLLIIFLRNKGITWSYIRHYAVLCLIPIPVVLYFYLMNKADWVIRAWQSQNILPSPSVWMYLIGYGLLIPMLIFGLWSVFKKMDNKKSFVVAWFITSAIAIYVPISFQRRLSEGLHIPIAILAMLGILFVFNWIRSKRGKWSLWNSAFVMILLLFLPMTNFLIIGQDITLYSKAKDLPYYIYQDEVNAMHWLRDNITIDEITFSSKYMGSFIPAHSGRVVWIGHSPQTVDLLNKKEYQYWFWEDDNESELKYDFLINNNIDYIFFGRKEKALGTYDPSTKNYLDNVYSNKEVTIYKLL